MSRPAPPRTRRVLGPLALALAGASILPPLADCQAYDRDEYEALLRDSGSTDALACPVSAGSEPCSFVPRLMGVQTVDGLDEDFCGVAENVFVAASGAARSIDGVATDAAPSGVDASVRLRVAWSAVGLHVFAHVAKTAVVTAPPDAGVYDYDALEIFAAGSSNLTGPYGGVPGTDRGAVHVIAAPPSAPGAPGQASLFQIGGNKVADLLPSQFVVKLVAAGFDVELVLDWGTLGLVSPPLPGALIAFDVALDLRFPDDGGSGRFQSYLGVLGTTVPDPTQCRSDAVYAPFCDDRLWCTPTLQ